jgi:hypothetical protein
MSANKIGRVDLNSYAITEYAVPTPKSFPAIITSGPDGALWFTEAYGNKIGQVILGTAPGAPTVVTAAVTDAEEVTVSFTAPASDGGSNITGYTVTSNPAGGIDENAGSTSLSHIVGNLKNGTAYKFTVTATNAKGLSTSSKPSNKVTTWSVPKKPAITSLTAGNAKVTVKFTAPKSNGVGAVTVYTVASNPAGGNDDSAGSTLLTHTVNSLTNGTPYTFTVKASNAVGTSTSHPSRAITPATVPDAPSIGTVTAGNKQATVNFTPLTASQDGGDPVTSYIVTPYIGATAGKTTSGQHSPIIVKGLTSGTAYTFTVSAKNKMGTGAASNASSSVTPQ